MDSSSNISNHEGGSASESRSSTRDGVTSYNQQPLPRRSHSDRPSYSRPTHHSGRENDLPPLPTPEQSSEARRQSIIAMDRKRRLTTSGHDNGRRRTTTGGFTNRDNRYYATPVRQHSNSQGSVPGAAVSPEVIDLTSSSPPAVSPLPLQRPPPRRSSNSSRGYVVPRWQPDSEVSECPICHRPFTLWFRRHHCRKCGRVVCNECSPHRITIPKQYIVQPPGYEEDPSQAPVIDLTRADNENDGFGSSGNGFRRMNPALGGGEKVRLCNPCVPDPQPESQAFFEQSAHAHPQQGSDISSFPNMPHLPPELGHSRSSNNAHPHGQQPHPGTRVHLDTTSDHEDSGSSPEAYTSASRQHILVGLLESIQVILLTINSKLLPRQAVHFLHSPRPILVTIP